MKPTHGWLDRLRLGLVDYEGKYLSDYNDATVTRSSTSQGLPAGGAVVSGVRRWAGRRVTRKERLTCRVLGKILRTPYEEGGRMQQKKTVAQETLHEIIRRVTRWRSRKRSYLWLNCSGRDGTAQ